MLNLPLDTPAPLVNAVLSYTGAFGAPDAVVVSPDMQSASLHYPIGNGEVETIVVYSEK